MNKFFLSASLLLLINFAADAQVTDRLHWIFPADSVDQIKFEVIDPYTVENWDGNQIMATSEITVHNASKGIVKFFIEENRRYDIVDTVLANVLVIDSYTSRRAPIQSKGQACYEQVAVTILVPNDFIKQSEDLWIKKEETEGEN